MNPDDYTLESILAEAETIAVVGLSDDPSRTSHRIAAYMQEAGYRVIPINPRIGSALGEKAYPSLGEVEVARGHRERIQAFAEEIPALADEAMEMRPRAFWMQKGIAHPASARRLEDAGVTAIQNLCIKTAHRELAQSPR